MFRRIFVEHHRFGPRKKGLVIRKARDEEMDSVLLMTVRMVFGGVLAVDTISRMDLPQEAYSVTRTKEAGAVACTRAWGPAVAVPSGQSESAALGKMTRDPCAASAARVRSLNPRALYRGVAGCPRSKGSGETRMGLVSRGSLSPSKPYRMRTATA